MDAFSEREFFREVIAFGALGGNPSGGPKIVSAGDRLRDPAMRAGLTARRRYDCGQTGVRSLEDLRAVLALF
ncbi:hypothetical protein [Roseibium alexandrii]|uniref:hypothetical protein n=1 Tax=Roseibium alexandrii TaxID=388408 RepID=UPI00375327F1